MVLGVLDSGVGGLDVLSKLVKHKVANRFIYLADNAKHPYGEKSATELERIVRNRIEILIDKGCDAVCLACNTASVTCLSGLRRSISQPVFGLLPAVYKAINATDGRILLLATSLTIQKLRLDPMYMDRVLAIPLHELASLIEQLDYSSIDKYLAEKLSGYSNISGIVLGCTHFVLIKQRLAKLFPSAKIFDGNDDLVRLIVSSLPVLPTGDFTPTVEYIFTATDQFKKYSQILSIIQ